MALFFFSSKDLASLKDKNKIIFCAGYLKTQMLTFIEPCFVVAEPRAGLGVKRMGLQQH